MPVPTLAQAIATIRAGRRAQGRAMLEQILAANPRNIMALLWMTEAVDTDQERREYLNRVLTVDPTSAAARKGLELLGNIEEIPSWMATDQLPVNPQEPSSSASLSTNDAANVEMPTATKSRLAATTKPVSVKSSTIKTKLTRTEMLLLSSAFVLVVFIVIAVILSSSRVSTSQTERSNGWLTPGSTKATPTAPLSIKPTPAFSRDVDCTELGEYATYVVNINERFTQYIDAANEELGKSDSDMDLDSLLRISSQAFDLAEKLDAAFDLNSWGIIDFDVQYRQAMRTFASGLDRFVKGKKLGDPQLVSTGLGWLNDYAVYYGKATDQLVVLSDICSE